MSKGERNWDHDDKGIMSVAINEKGEIVGILVVVIDVNPSHGFWTAKLMKVFGHEGQCTCIYNTHGWIVYIMLFLVVCGTSRGSSWLRRNDFLKMTK
jgi:hypothetical protein